MSKYFSIHRFLLTIFLVQCCLAVEYSDLFNENACLSRKPDSELLTVDGDKLAPIEIVATNDLKSPVKVTISSKQVIEGFLVQALVNNEKLNKIVGAWDLKNSSSAKTLNCSSADVSQSKNALFINVHD